MISDVKSVSLDSSVKDVSQLMNENNIRHVPIVQEGKLVGIICRSDIAKWFYEKKWDPGDFSQDINITDISEIMTRKVIAVRENKSIEDAAEILYGKEFHCLPVVDSRRRLVGIITTADIIRCLLSRTRFLV